MVERLLGSPAQQERRSYSHKEVIDASTEYFKGDFFAASTWANKYALKDSAGRIYERTPEDMHRRIAREFARIESKYPNPLSENEIHGLLANFKYVIPQGSPQAGIGNDFQVASLSNCFVIGNSADSYGGIARTDEEQIQLMKRRAGVGHDLSHLRPSGSPVANSALNSTGMVTFMDRYSNSTREVAQDGRRGALMLTSSVRHPNIDRFVDIKMTPGKVTGANVSVKMHDDFMRAAINNEEYTLQFPIDSSNPSFTRKIRAKDLWDKIINNAWNSAEPGILFWDTITRESIPDCYQEHGFRTMSTNPCGEIPLCPYDSCRLLVLNLYSYVDNPFTKDAKFNMPLFRKHVGQAQRLMDDLVDLELEKIDKILAKIDGDPEKEEIKFVERNLWKKIREKAEKGRRTGLGITAEADMLAALGLKYGSQEAIEFSANVVHKNHALGAYSASVQLAEERGAFPIYDSELESNNPFINRVKKADPELYEKMTKIGRRNIALLTVAPTGSTSIEAQTSSGVQNVFDIAYVRRRKVNPNDKNVRVDSTDGNGDSWQHYYIVHHKFEDWAKANGYDINEVRRIAEDSLKDSPTRNESARRLEELIAVSPYHETMASKVDWVNQVKMQGAIQKWVDHSISVTVNLPSTATQADVKKVYQTAWEEGCKGITVYRESSREGVLISGNQTSKKNGLVGKLGTMANPLKIPGIMPAVKIKQPTPWGNLHVNLVVDPSNDYAPVEVFGALGDAGSVEAADIEMAGRLTSLWLRSGGKPEDVIHQLIRLGSGVIAPPTRDGGVQSLPMGFAKALQRYEIARKKHDIGEILTGKYDFDKIDGEISDILRTGKTEKESEEPQNDNASLEVGKRGILYNLGKCDQCGSKNLFRQDGCLKCKDCGNSKCG